MQRKGWGRGRTEHLFQLPRFAHYLPERRQSQANVEISCAEDNHGALQEFVARELEKHGTWEYGAPSDRLCLNF